MGATVSFDPSSHPLYPLCNAWIAKIRLAERDKYDKFGKWAEEALKFFDGAHDFMWDGKADAASKGGVASFMSMDSQSWKPTFRMSYNRMFEAVALYGPAMYFRNPSVLCSPLGLPEIAPEALGVDVNDPIAVQYYQMALYQQQQISAQRSGIASCYETYLNWLQNVGDKKRQVRRAIVDALITGAGYLTCSLDTNEQGTMRFPRSIYVSSADILKDPDASYEEDVQWMARKVCLPVNLVEAKYGLPPGTLRGHIRSYNSEASQKTNKKHATGKSFDLIEYFEIYSKNGAGNQLKGEYRKDVAVFDPDSTYDASWLGRYVHLVVAEGIPFPLNIPSPMLADQEAAFMAAQWPCPFWQELNRPLAWPFVELRFYDKPGNVWPVSLFKAVAGEMKFINWCMSFLADKAASSCQTIQVRAKAAGAAIQEQLAGGTAPFQVIELSDLLNMKPQELVAFIQAPQFPVDIWTVIAQVDQAIDKRLGLTELLYGMSSRQMRSAEEASLKGEQVSIRPDDMANSVEDWVTLSVVKEAETARYHLQPEDVQMVLGPMGAHLWQNHLQTTDPDVVVKELAFHIEAGSTRKPNKQNRVSQLQELAQYALPVFQQFAAMGEVTPFNALMAELGKAMDMDPGSFQIQGMQPAQPQPDPAQEAKAAATEQEMQLDQMRMVMDQERHQQEMTQDQERHEQEMEQSKQDQKLQAQKTKADVAAKKAAARRQPARARA